MLASFPLQTEVSEASLKAIMNILTFTYKGQDIDVTVNNGFVAYSFIQDGQSYGAKVKLPSRKTQDVVAITSNLIINAIETYEELCQPNNSLKSSKKSTQE